MPPVDLPCVAPKLATVAKSQAVYMDPELMETPLDLVHIDPEQQKTKSHAVYLDPELK